MSPDGSSFWVSTIPDAYLFLSTDRGTTWFQLQSQPTTAIVAELSSSPEDANLVFAVTTDGRLWAYRQQSANWRRERSRQSYYSFDFFQPAPPSLEEAAN